jgi:hypothetical protein
MNEVTVTATQQFGHFPGEADIQRAALHELYL